MRTTKTRNGAEKREGRAFASGWLSFVPPASVALIGLIYAIVAATVVYLIGGVAWTVVVAFLLGGASAMKIAAAVRADILREFQISDIPPDTLTEQKKSAGPEEPCLAGSDALRLSRTGDQRADDTAGV
ncbi:hypothetical protein BOO69_02680 [Sulfitobacter alexandrii]|uniref:Uncharacterized protein n=1 Tax=Sulfitobacter alexandrii TaxID=1917485 RepID=A0A1J0WDR7_9RHOB|nr:hypothetical protein [Sulfitobacter alexandrii]APE42443.1 hypothetical protein BOO69_02680 [Sulfitobacter alexandrii]